MKNLPLLCTLVYLLFSVTTFSQSEPTNHLVGSITNQCTILFPSDPEKCNLNNYELLSQKLAEGESYLIAELSKMKLVDSSTYYNEIKQEVIALEKSIEKRTNPGKVESLEQSYLLLSLLKPNKSDSLFIKLVHSFYTVTPVSYNSHQPECFLNYKVWLFDLLDQRFKDETDNFSRQLSALYLNKIAPYFTSPFRGIEKENLLIEKLINLAEKATSTNQIDFSYDELVTKIYENRGYKAIERYPTLRNAKLYRHIENIYLKAIDLSPMQSQLKYNLGMFYYNEAIYLLDEKKFNATDEERANHQLRIEALQEKATLYMQPKK